MNSTRAIETAADYADALMTARAVKHLLLLLLMLMLLSQIAMFFIARYTTVLDPLIVPTTQPVLTGAPGLADARPMHRILQYLTGVTDFLGILFALLLSVVLLLIVNIMLVGRLIGVARVTSAFIWSVLLILLLFPWQAFLNSQNFTEEWKVPGVLYTWSELVTFARFSTTDRYYVFIKWTRFVVLPIVTVFILLTIQIKSSRGMRQALGEEEVTAIGDHT